MSLWRWQERYVEAGADGLLRDKIRSSRSPALNPAKVADVIRRTLDQPLPSEAIHWTVRAMAEASGISPAKGAPDLAGGGPGAALRAAVQTVD